MKIIALVNAGERARLTVPRNQRRWLRLLYLHVDFPRGTHKAILQACRRLSSKRARQRECGWGPMLKRAQWACASRYTQFSGGFALDFANAPRRGRCAKLIVQTTGKQRTLRKHLFAPGPRACRGAA
jgi:hypothetical protein